MIPSIADVNPRVVLGNNSIHAELEELREKIRAERKLQNMSPAWRSRWEMLLSANLSPTDKLIGLVISFFADDDGTNARPTMAVVEVLTGLKKRRVTQGAAECVKAGMLVRQSGGYRGKAVSYDLAIPQKTLSEIAERLLNPAPIMPCLPKREQPDAPIEPERVHGGATFSPQRVHEDAPKAGERVHGGATHLTKDSSERVLTPEDDDDEAEDVVHVNGASIRGPGFELTYKTVEMTAFLAGISFDRGKMIAEIAARDWASRGFIPESPAAMLKSAMRHDAINGQIDNLRLRLAAAQQAPPQTARGSPERKHWRDEQREKKAKNDEIFRQAAENYAKDKRG